MLQKLHFALLTDTVPSIHPKLTDNRAVWRLLTGKGYVSQRV